MAIILSWCGTSALQARKAKELAASNQAFIVENIEEYYSTMSQKGLHFMGPPPSLTQDGKVVVKAIYAQDPENNWLEFVEFLQ